MNLRSLAAPSIIFLALVAMAEAQDPRITSSLSIEGSPGETLFYSITATGNPIGYDAFTDSPSLELVAVDPETGALEILISLEPEAGPATVGVSALYEDDQTAEAELTVVIRDVAPPAEGSPRAIQASIAVKPPRVDKNNYELVAKFLLKGKFHRQLAETEPTPGTFEARLATNRVSNKDILKAMVGTVDGFDSIEGWSLAMISPFEGEPTLFAVKKNTDPVEVPTSVLEITSGDRVGSSKTVINEDDDEKSSRLKGYQAMTVEWMQESEDNLTLTGLAKYNSQLKFISIDGSPERYISSGLKASLQGARVDTE